MHELLSAMGRSFLRAFLAALVVFAPGILSAPNLAGAGALGVAALCGSFAAGLKAIQTYVPQLTLSHWLGAPYGVFADSFLRAFLASLIAGVAGILAQFDQSTAKALATAAIVGALTAGFRALQGLLTQGEHPAAATGIRPPVAPSSHAAATVGAQKAAA